MDAAYRLLASHPHVGQKVQGKQVAARRLILHKSRYWIYYHVIESEEIVEVIALWQANQQAEPEL